MRSKRGPLHPVTAPPKAVRRWLTALLALAIVELALVGRGNAQTPHVPISVQADLLVKVAAFDRNFVPRAGNKAIVLLVAIPGDPESERAALEMKAALGQVPKIGELPHHEELVQFTTAAALADLVRSRKAAIVYFGPGFGRHAGALREALSSVSVLSAGGLPEYVPSGIVLGFDLASARPKLLVNLSQAKKQQVAFPASVLNLMKVRE